MLKAALVLADTKIFVTHFVLRIGALNKITKMIVSQFNNEYFVVINSFNILLNLPFPYPLY